MPHELDNSIGFLSLEMVSLGRGTNYFEMVLHKNFRNGIVECSGAINVVFLYLYYSAPSVILIVNIDPSSDLNYAHFWLHVRH